MASIFSTEWGGQTYVASVGSLGGREAAQMAEAMVESDFSDSEGAESVGFSQGQLGLVGAVRTDNLKTGFHMSEQTNWTLSNNGA